MKILIYNKDNYGSIFNEYSKDEIVSFVAIPDIYKGKYIDGNREVITDSSVISTQNRDVFINKDIYISEIFSKLDNQLKGYKYYALKTQLLFFYRLESIAELYYEKAIFNKICFIIPKCYSMCNEKIINSKYNITIDTVCMNINIENIIDLRFIYKNIENSVIKDQSDINNKISMLSIVKEVILNDKKIPKKMFPIIHNKSTNQKTKINLKDTTDNQYNITQKVHESANEYKPDISEVSIKNTNDTVINDTNISDTLIVIEESGVGNWVCSIKTMIPIIKELNINGIIPDILTSTVTKEKIINIANVNFNLIKINNCIVEEEKNELINLYKHTKEVFDQLNDRTNLSHILFCRSFYRFFTDSLTYMVDRLFIKKLNQDKIKRIIFINGFSLLEDCVHSYFNNIDKFIIFGINRGKNISYYGNDVYYCVNSHQCKVQLINEGIMSERILLSGSTFYEFGLTSRNYEITIPQKKDVIIVTTENLRINVEPVLIKEILDILFVNNIYVILKVHPAENKDKYMTIIPKNNEADIIVIHDEADICDILKYSKLVISHSSNCVFQAIVHNIPVFSYKKYYENLPEVNIQIKFYTNIFSDNNSFCELLTKYNKLKQNTYELLPSIYRSSNGLPSKYIIGHMLMTNLVYPSLQFIQSQQEYKYIDNLVQKYLNKLEYETYKSMEIHQEPNNKQKLSEVFDSMVDSYFDKILTVNNKYISFDADISILIKYIKYVTNYEYNVDKEHITLCITDDELLEKIKLFDVLAIYMSNIHGLKFLIGYRMNLLSEDFSIYRNEYIKFINSIEINPIQTINIIGNGKSIKEIEFDKLKGATITCNGFIVGAKMIDIKHIPNIHVILNPFDFIDNIICSGDDIYNNTHDILILNTIQMDNKNYIYNRNYFNKNGLANNVKLYDIITQRDSTYTVNNMHKMYFGNSYMKNKNSNYTREDCDIFNKYASLMVNTLPQILLRLAVYLGGKDIRLYGFDMPYSFDHFYSENYSTRDKLIDKKNNTFHTMKGGRPEQLYWDKYFFMLYLNKKLAEKYNAKITQYGSNASLINIFNYI